MVSLVLPCWYKDVFVFLHLHFQRWPFSLPDSFLLGQNSVRVQLSVPISVFRKQRCRRLLCVYRTRLFVLCWLTLIIITVWVGGSRGSDICLYFSDTTCGFCESWLLFTYCWDHHPLGPPPVRGHRAACPVSVAPLGLSGWHQCVHSFTLWPPAVVHTSVLFTPGGWLGG